MASEVLDAERNLEDTLARVPAMYFRSDFSLKDPDTFLAVTHQPGTIGDAVRDELPARLGDYLDLVEVSLWKQIACRADSFYGALSTLKALHLSLAETNEKIAHLRAHMQQLRDTLVAKPLTLLARKRKSENVERVTRLLAKISEVKDSRETIGNLISTSQYQAALDLIDSTSALLGADLASIRALDPLRKQMGEYRELITRTMGSRLQQLGVLLPGALSLTRSSRMSTPSSR